MSENTFDSSRHVVTFQNVSQIIDATQLEVGCFGELVDDGYKGIVIRTWTMDNSVHLVLLNNPSLCWSKVERGMFKVIPIRPGSKITIDVGK